MAELFMECEEEELEPWQQKEKAIVVDDDDDDDEPIFVGEILSSKPANTYILNRVDPNSPRMGIQNGAPKRGAAVAVSSGFPAATRPATSTLAVQPQPRAGSVSGTLQRPLSGCSSPQEATKSNAGISPPTNRSAPIQSLSRNLNIPVLVQSASRPVATVTAQPVVLNRVTQNNTPDMVNVRPNLGVSPCQSGSVVNSTGLSKRPSTSEASSINPKKAKANEMGSGSDSPVSPSVKSPIDTSSVQKGVTSGSVKNGAPFPQACPKCNIHFNLLDPLKNHMKYCCPDLVHTFLGITKRDCSGTSTKIAETEKGKLIMLVNDFYYGKYEGNVQQVRQEQKTHTTFKCASCMKLLKNNLRFMNHMKHHLEFEKQNSESWESHTTCQHCYRQFPTPFQLQCHIESTHTPFESSTVCKICELSFETEQVLLQHMKDNHKPGEMPYVCQVCSYRSSAFSDVEKHFRAVHENTKNLLCPFCLKVIKIGAPYMHHYMRHQKKGVHRCTKCRLQFLTCKEKMDHKSQHHRTFKKPVQLEGLPPGTKVTIRASVGSLHPGTTTTSSLSTSASTLQLSPNTKIANTKNHAKLNANKAKPKLKPLSVQKKQSLGISSSSSQNSSSTNKKNNKIANTALNNLRCSEIQKCIECYSDIRTFASHFPAYVRCSLCRYSTSCSKAYVNHMMSFHSARQSKRFWIYRNHSEELRGFTVVCLNCDFLNDVSGLDKMATHLNENPTHSCQVIIENVSLNYLDAENLSDLLNNELPNNENEEKGQKISKPTTPDGKKKTSAFESQQTNYSAEETKEDHPGNQASEGPLAPECKKSKSSVLENSSGSGVQACSEDSMDAAEEGGAGSLGNQANEDPLAAGGTENKSSVLENFPSSGVQTILKDSMDAAEEGDIDCLGNHADADPLAAGSTIDKSSVLENFPHSEVNTCSKDSMGASEGGERDCLGNQTDEGKEKESSVLENSSGPGVQTCSKDSLDATKGGDTDCLGNQADADLLAAGCTENKSSVLENLPDSELQTCSAETMDAVEDGDTENQADADPLAAGGTENESSVLENFPNSGLQTCSTDTMDAVGNGDTDCLENQGDADPLAAGGTENESSVLENFPNSELQTCSAETMDAVEDGDIENQADAGPLAAGGTENESSVLENFPNSGLQTSSKDTLNVAEEGDTDCLGNQVDEGKENESLVLENYSGPGVQACSKDAVDFEEEGNTGSLGNQTDEATLTVSNVDASESAVEDPSISELHPCSKDSVVENADSVDSVKGRNAGSLGNQSDDVSLATGYKENKFIQEISPGLAICPSEPIDSKGEANGNNLKNEVSLVAECGSASPLGDTNIEPQASSERTECGDSNDDGDHAKEEKSKKPKTGQDSDVEVSSDAMEVSDTDERLAEMNARNSNSTSEEGVSFEQFLRRRGEPESASSDTSEQGSVHLEPLTPSEVLEHEATEILQKGGVAPSAKKAGPGSEQADVVAVSTENSPVQAEASVSQTEESSEAS